MKNVYREQVCLNGIKGSKKGKSHYKTINVKVVLQLPEENIHREFVPEKQTVNGKFHKELLKSLIT
jgi:hypothetical protein